MRPGTCEAPAHSAERQDMKSLIDRAYEKAMEVLGEDVQDLHDFDSVYGTPQVGADIAYVERLDVEMAKGKSPEDVYHKKVGTVLEALFYEQARHNGWLGPDTSVKKTKKFDDYLNGVDCVAEHTGENGSSFLAMAIDATSSSHAGSKFNRIRDDLVRGRLAELKYVQTESMMGPLHDIPKVVVGASPEHMEGAVALWLDGNSEALENHPIQTLILEEIVTQLEGFKFFMEGKAGTTRDPRAKARYTEIVAKFTQYLDILKPVFTAKQSTAPADSLKDDLVLRGIKGQLNGLNIEHIMKGGARVWEQKQPGSAEDGR